MIPVLLILWYKSESDQNHSETGYTILASYILSR